ncbi:UbiA family prenyltransferase [Nocardioides sp. GY 10127]|uniref:UbiA family prenyltransferase n=1 Tax=Nocardioides sp. GY 10127 TaxID=2569762 RepID=UPI0010A7C9ED|nr:UbiA family prenyltransferase [Nocardioides sp. GY 10127]TIC78901.1 hypothetical protein E8D37_18655 [Nocardioides sp. GY 10127]
MPSPRRRPTPVLLVLAAHPARTVLLAAVLPVAAALAGRPAREVWLVAATALCGQVLLAWAGDAADAARPGSSARPGRPVADGRLDLGTAWFAAAVAGLVLVPLAVANGWPAGCCYLASVAVGLLGTRLGRTGPFSWWSWALGWALYPAFLSLGGWGGLHRGDPPEPVLVGLAALAGVGVHVLVSTWELVEQREDGWDTLPLRLGLALGANRLLLACLVYLALVAAATAWAGTQLGLAAGGS